MVEPHRGRSDAPWWSAARHTMGKGGREPYRGAAAHHGRERETAWKRMKRGREPPAVWERK
jgi:hypothetical protein